MRKRTLIGAAATALACGIMVAAFCPGSAMARYTSSTLDLTSTAVKDAVTMQLDTNYEASVTDVSTGAQTDQMRVFKFTPTADGSFTFKVTQYSAASNEGDMYYVLYDSTGARITPARKGDYDSDGGVDNTAGIHPYNLSKDSTYYLVVSEYNLDCTWVETVSVRQLKVAKSATLTMVNPVSANTVGVFKATFTYEDNTTKDVWLDYQLNNSKGIVIKATGNSLIGRSITDDDYNAVYFDSYADDTDGAKKAAAAAGTVGTYAINCSLLPVNMSAGSNVSIGTTDLKIVSDATQVASAKAVALQNTMTMGFYKITARLAGLLYLEGNSVIYKYDATTKVLTSLSKGYYDDDDGDIYAASVKMTKGQVLYVEVLGNLNMMKNGVPSLAASYYVPNANAAKVAQTIKVKKATATYKATVLKKAAKSFAIGASAKTACTYKVISGAKWVTVTKAGKVTVKKGAKKGVYKVRVTAKTSIYYKAATRVITIRVK